jgi:hypothetical protein
MFAGARVFLGIAVCLTVLSAAMAQAAYASSKYDTLKAGPPVGAKIPHDLKTVDHQNQYQDFKSLAHSRGLVILFSRSLDW